MTSQPPREALLQSIAAAQTLERITRICNRLEAALYDDDLDLRATYLRVTDEVAELRAELDGAKASGLIRVPDETSEVLAGADIHPSDALALNPEVEPRPGLAEASEASEAAPKHPENYVDYQVTLRHDAYLVAVYLGEKRKGEVKMTTAQWERFLSWCGGEGTIQNMLADLSDDDRELLLSGLNSEDWADLAREEDEEDDE